MPKLGELTLEELLDGADRDAAYLAERLETQRAARGTDPTDIEEVITSAVITNIRSQLIVATARLRAQRQTD